MADSIISSAPRTTMPYPLGGVSMTTTTGNGSTLLDASGCLLGSATAMLGDVIDRLDDQSLWGVYYLMEQAKVLLHQGHVEMLKDPTNTETLGNISLKSNERS